MVPPRVATASAPGDFATTVPLNAANAAVGKIAAAPATAAIRASFLIWLNSFLGGHPQEAGAGQNLRDPGHPSEGGAALGACVSALRLESDQVTLTTVCSGRFFNS